MNKELTLEEKIGQMLIVGINGSEFNDDISKFIVKYKVGGIILFGRNIKSISQMIKLINDIKECNKKNGNIPLFIAVDYEGGRVNRFPKTELEKLPAAYKIGQINDLNYAYKIGECLGNVLSSLGFNMNFGPVLDLKMTDDNAAIGDRAYSEKAETVCKLAKEIKKGSDKYDILSVVKHFPGHGLTKKDTHILIPYINKNSKVLEEHLKPFKFLIKNKIDGLLLSHIIIKDFDRINPVTLSAKTINNIIRKNYKYENLIISDDLTMKSLLFRFLFQIPLAKAFKSGSDMLMLCHDAVSREKAIDKVIKVIKDNPEKFNSIDDSVKRILEMKKKYKIEDSEVKMPNLDTLNKFIIERRDSITE